MTDYAQMLSLTEHMNMYTVSSWPKRVQLGLESSQAVSRIFEEKERLAEKKAQEAPECSSLVWESTQPARKQHRIEVEQMVNKKGEP